MDVRPEYYSLSELLHNRLFRIPQYQRAYSWGSKQRRDLFDDIRNSYEKKGDMGHFMATIVGLGREKISIRTDEYRYVDIVDGQQRITTLILLIKAIERALDCRTDGVAQETLREIREVLVKPDETSLLLLQTNHDTSDLFANYIRNADCPEPNLAKTLADRNILEGIRECEDFVRDWQSDGGCSPTDLYRHLKNRLTFVFHEIGDERLVYTVFEVLNSRGLEVPWFDRLKSMLMAVVFEGNGNRDEIIGEVHRHWSDIYRIVGRRLGLNTEALRFAATLRSDHSVSKVLSEEDSAHLLAGESNGSSKKVIDTSLWLKSVTKAVDRTASDQRRNAVTRISQARLLAVAVFLRSDFSESQKETILRRWESVTFRIYGLYAKDARTAVGAYVRLAWRIVKDKLQIDEIMNSLSDIGREYPSEKAVEELRKKDCYPDRSEELRYFFARYEEYLANEAGQKFNNEQWNHIWESSASDSVEHIQPTSSERKYVHWLGNLMILPHRLNSSLGNKRPSEKAGKYRETGLLAAQEVAKSISGKWGRRQVVEREDRLLAWAKKEWGD